VRPPGLPTRDACRRRGQSDFYDKQSNNQVLRMQTQYQLDQAPGNLEEQLKCALMAT
jgi:hypothetical protein